MQHIVELDRKFFIHGRSELIAPRHYGKKSSFVEYIRHYFYGNRQCTTPRTDLMKHLQQQTALHKRGLINARNNNRVSHSLKQNVASPVVAKPSPLLMSVQQSTPVTSKTVTCSASMTKSFPPNEIIIAPNTAIQPLTPSQQSTPSINKPESSQHLQPNLPILGLNSGSASIPSFHNHHYHHSNFKKRKRPDDTQTSASADSSSAVLHDSVQILAHAKQSPGHVRTQNEMSRLQAIQMNFASAALADAVTATTTTVPSTLASNIATSDAYTHTLSAVPSGHDDEEEDDDEDNDEDNDSNCMLAALRREPVVVEVDPSSSSSSQPRSVEEKALLIQMKVMGFDKDYEILDAMRAWHTRTGHYPSEVELMCAIIQQREELEEARKMDEARAASERSRKEEAQRLREAQQRDMEERMLESSLEEWRTNNQFFPHSWILHSQAADTLQQLVFSNVDAKHIFMKLLHLEKKAYQWYKSDLPRAYFSSDLCNRLVSMTSTADIQTQLEKEIQSLEVAMYRLSGKWTSYVVHALLHCMLDIALCCARCRAMWRCTSHLVGSS
jgi:hypothetical protein